MWRYCRNYNILVYQMNAGMEYNFEKKKWNTEVIDYGVPFDYGYVM